jgi:hypothetical protein
VKSMALFSSCKETMSSGFSLHFFLSPYIHMCVCVWYIYIYTFVCMYANVYVHMYTRMCMYMHALCYWSGISNNPQNVITALFTCHVYMIQIHITCKQHIYTHSLWQRVTLHIHVEQSCWIFKEIHVNYQLQPHTYITCDTHVHITAHVNIMHT